MRRRGVIRVRARCLIVDEEGRILVQRTPDGLVEVPGGRVEYDEYIPFCLVRELREEAGVEVEPRELVYIVEYRGAKRGKRRHEVLFYFRCRMRGVPHEKERGLRFEWMSPESLSSERFWPKPLLDYIIEDYPNFDFIRFIAMNDDRVEYILSRKVLSGEPLG
jgi:8-oxo-dGTP diphosphatase